MKSYENPTVHLLTIVIDGEAINVRNVEVSAIISLLQVATYAHFTVVVPEEARAIVQDLTGGWTAEQIDALNTRVDELDLSVRTANVLGMPMRGYSPVNPQVDFVWQIAEMTESDFLSRRNAGRKSLEKVKKALMGMGLEMGSRSALEPIRHRLRTE